MLARPTTSTLFPYTTLFRSILGSTHAYFPAGHGNLDNVDGLLHAREFLARLVGGQPMDWASLLQPPLFVPESQTDRKSTRLNSSHGYISYAVFCLKKKNVNN